MMKKVEDYLNMGVPYVFILDPESRRAWRGTREGLIGVQELRIENPDIVIPLAVLFEDE